MPKAKVNLAFVCLEGFFTSQKIDVIYLLLFDSSVRLLRRRRRRRRRGRVGGPADG